MNREYKKGEIIFKQGEYAPVMYDILAGSVGAYTGYGTEDETLLAVMNAGQFLGEMGVIEAYPRSATAVAMEDGTTLREIDDKEFSDYFYEQPARLLLIMQQISARLRDRTADYEAACRIRDELLATQKAPAKRSNGFFEKLEAILAFYNDSKMNNFPY